MTQNVVYLDECFMGACKKKKMCILLFWLK